MSRKTGSREASAGKIPKSGERQYTPHHLLKTLKRRAPEPVKTRARRLLARVLMNFGAGGAFVDPQARLPYCPAPVEATRHAREDAPDVSMGIDVNDDRRAGFRRMRTAI
ncbi:MAG: hypothetical protein AMXMBFR22_30610 [Phycisphaerae bacterium]